MGDEGGARTTIQQPIYSPTFGARNRGAWYIISSAWGLLPHPSNAEDGEANLSGSSCTPVVRDGGLAAQSSSLSTIVLESYPTAAGRTPPQQVGPIRDERSGPQPACSCLGWNKRLLALLAA
jgi:hypothetical protein